MDLHPVINEIDSAAVNRIRVETALSRFPMHRLAKKGEIAIKLKEVKWEITYTVKHGQPGPLAYKVDTLIVNRKVDEAMRPVPKVIKLGSLYQIAQNLGLGGDTNAVKKALLQNASAFVECSIKYKSRDGREKELEQGDTRYGVIFTGDKLPEGVVADAVYLVLHDWYRQLLDDVMFRPLDYDYLKKLTPAAQRFYELLSFQLFGAIRSKRPRAKMLYSDYCTHSPQTQYFDWERVRKQMYKLHAPHIESGYIAKVAFEETVAAGQPDWEMYYTPGPKAEREYRAFTMRNSRVTQPLALESRVTEVAPRQQQLPLHQEVSVEDRLYRELVQRGITASKARALLSNRKPGQDVMAQLQHMDSVLADSPRGKFRNPAGMYVRFIEENVPVPETQRKGQGTPSRQAEYDEYCRQEIDRFAAKSKEYRTILERQRQETKASFPTMLPLQIEQLAHHAACSEIKVSGRVKLLSFDQFVQLK